MTATAVPRAWTGTRPQSFDAIFDRAGSVRSLAVLRIVLGPITVVHLLPYLADTRHGVTYLDHFNHPWFTFLPELPGGVQVVMVWTGAVAAVVLALGWHTRLAGSLTLACVAGNLFLSQTYYHHNRAFLLFLLAGVTLGESGRVLSLDARRAGRSPTDDRTTIWPLWLLRALVASVYFASGFSKLIDPDWRGGLVLWDRAVRYQDLVRARLPGGPVGNAIIDIVTTRWVHAVTSPIAIAMELFIAFGLWSARTRLAAVWVAVFFHLSIELTASVEIFSAAGIAALAIWAIPVTRDRIVTVDDGRWVRRLDWLARFDVRVSPGTELRVVDRDGSETTGADARLLVASRLPLTFMVAGPLLALRRVRGLHR